MKAASNSVPVAAGNANAIHAFPFISQQSTPIEGEVEVCIPDIVNAILRGKNRRDKEILVCITHTAQPLPIYPFTAGLQKRGIEILHVIPQSHRTFIVTISSVSVVAAQAAVEEELSAGTDILSGISRPLSTVDFESWCVCFREALTNCSQSVLVDRLVKSSDDAASAKKKYEQTRLLEAFIEVVREGNLDTVLSTVDDIFSRVRDEAWSIEEVAELCTHTLLIALSLSSGAVHSGTAGLPLTAREWLSNAYEHCWKWPDLCRYLKHFLSILLGSDKWSVLPVHSVQIERVIAFINQEYDKGIDVAKLATLVFLSPSYLSKRFKTETGMTIHDFIVQTRMTKAKGLLAEKLSLKAYEVGQYVGYADPTYFNKLFKRQVGITPNVFRERAMRNN